MFLIKCMCVKSQNHPIRLVMRTSNYQWCKPLSYNYLCIFHQWQMKCYQHSRKNSTNSMQSIACTVNWLGSKGPIRSVNTVQSQYRSENFLEGKGTSEHQIILRKIWPKPCSYSKSFPELTLQAIILRWRPVLGGEASTDRKGPATFLAGSMAINIKGGGARRSSASMDAPPAQPLCMHSRIPCMMWRFPNGRENQYTSNNFCLATNNEKKMGKSFTNLQNHNF